MIGCYVDAETLIHIRKMQTLEIISDECYTYIVDNDFKYFSNIKIFEINTRNDIKNKINGKCLLNLINCEKIILRYYNLPCYDFFFLRKLKCIKLCRCAITDSDINIGNNLSKITKLELIGCDNITNNGLKNLYKYSKIKNLCVIKYESINNDGVQHIINPTTLEYLKITGSKFNNSFWKKIFLCKLLTKLDLNYNNLSNCDLFGISKCAALKYLYIGNEEMINDNRMKYFIGMNLIKLHLAYLNITSNILQYVGRIPNLRFCSI